MSKDLKRQLVTPRISGAMCAFGRGLGEPRLSSGAERLAYVSTISGSTSLVLREREIDQPWGPEIMVSSAPAIVASRSYGGGAFHWLPDASAVVYVASGGDTGGGMWLQPIEGGPPSWLRDGRLSAPCASPDGSKVACVVDTRQIEVMNIDIGSGTDDGAGTDDRSGVGESLRLSGDPDFCFDPVWSPDGAWVAWHEWDVPAMPWDSSRIVVRRSDGSGECRTVAGGEGIAVQQPRFSPDGKWLTYLSDEGEGRWLNLWGCRWPQGEGSHPLVEEPNEHGGPSWGQGQRSYVWAPDSTGIAYCRNEEGYGSLWVVVMDESGPGSSFQISRGIHGGLSWEANIEGADTLVSVRSGAKTPTSIVEWRGLLQHRAETGSEAEMTAKAPRREILALGPVAGFEAADPQEPELVAWVGDDGVKIPGRLYRPRGANNQAGPLIAWVHGGPTDQWGVTFNPRISYWVDRGWAVLVPDHRGSTGHGRAFTQALAGRWGELDVADVAAGLRASIDQGWADPRCLVVMGGSAGGFTVLNLLASHPGLCAAGVDCYGVADLVDLAKSTHRFEAHYCDSLVGPLPQSQELYRGRSPLYRADEVMDPLLILHGSQDEVVPVAQSQAIAARLEQLGRTVEIHLYEGEGHGWGRPETVIDELERIESFLQRHVLGKKSI